MPEKAQRTATLKAHYTSPHNAPLTLETTLPITIPIPIPSPTAAASTPQDRSAVADKTAYLATLREAVAALQGRVNAELTARMEEDARGAGAGGGTGERGSGGGKKAKAGATAVVDEEAEEENYGEEVVGED